MASRCYIFRRDRSFSPYGNGILNDGVGNDRVTSYYGDARSSGNDRLSGGTGNDTLISGDGSDTLQGGAGKDTLEGDADQDLFVFDIGKSFNRSIGVDTIVDFDRSDRIVLDKTTFKGLKGKKASFASVKSISTEKCCLHHLYPTNWSLVLQPKR